MASQKQRANRTAFGISHGKHKAGASAQMKRELERLAAYRKKPKT